MEELKDTTPSDAVDMKSKDKNNTISDNMKFDKLKLTPCPIVCPNIEEFADPVQFFTRKDIVQLGNQYGILKIVPPDGWKPPFLISPAFKFHTRLQRISDLGLQTRSREFFKKSINRFLKMRGKRQLRLYFRAGKRDFSEKLLSRPKVYYYDLYQAVERAGGAENMKEDDWKALNIVYGILPLDSPYLEEEYNVNLKGYALFLASNSASIHEGAFTHSLMSGVQEHGSRDEDEVDGRRRRRSDDSEDNCSLCSKADKPAETLLCDGCDRAYHMGCLDPPVKEVPVGSWYCDKCLIGTGAYGFEEQVNVKYSIPEFHRHCQEFAKDFEEEYNDGKPLSVDEIECKFWEFVGMEKLDMEVRYGADIHNMRPGEILGFPVKGTPMSGSPEEEYYANHPFNLTNLPFADGLMMKYIDTSISGMTIPWIYVGSLLLTFCWHVEDHYTLLINYCHMGATKKWYGIPASFADKFEKLMKDSAPDLFKRQPDLLHQLVTLLLPMVLLENGIKCVYADQQPNEFIVTYPRVYHAGFNCGFNFNEAVNFIIDPWLEHGERAVQDYKEIKKENVFSHYHLEQNLLQDYLRRPQDFDSGFIRRVVDNLERFHLNEMEAIKCNGSSMQIHRKYSSRLMNGQMMSPELAPYEDEEPLCDDCKTYLGYHHYSVPNHEHQLSRLKYERLVASGEVVGSIKSKSGSPRALTPPFSQNGHPTPKEQVEDVLVKRESESEDVTKIQQSESNRRLSMLMGNEMAHETLSKEEEFEALILSAREVTGEPNTKRRRSTRIQRQEETTVASISRAKKFVPPANEKTQLRLCVECSGIYGGEMPQGAQLIYDRAPQDVLDLVRLVRMVLG